jgi:arginyl-tRNA synthetase
VIDRVERLDASLLLYVVGAPQAQHLQMVAAVAKQAGWLQAPREMVHVAFGNVLGADRKMLKTRSGDTIKLDALLTEAVERAAAAVAQNACRAQGAEPAAPSWLPLQRGPNFG